MVTDALSCSLVMRCHGDQALPACHTAALKPELFSCSLGSLTVEAVQIEFAEQHDTGDNIVILSPLGVGSIVDIEIRAQPCASCQHRSDLGLIVRACLLADQLVEPRRMAISLDSDIRVEQVGSAQPDREFVLPPGHYSIQSGLGVY